MFRIDATAVSSGIATAGSVPKTNSRMMSAPKPPSSVSPRTDGPELSPLAAALISGSRPVTQPWTPGGSTEVSARCVCVAPVSEPKLCWPGRKISTNVVWPSFETYILLPVEKSELERAPGFAATAMSTAWRTPSVWRMFPFDLRTTTSGAFSPEPNALVVRWFAS